MATMILAAKYMFFPDAVVKEGTGAVVQNMVNWAQEYSFYRITRTPDGIYAEGWTEYPEDGFPAFDANALQDSVSMWGAEDA